MLGNFTASDGYRDSHCGGTRAGLPSVARNDVLLPSSDYKGIRQKLEGFLRQLRIFYCLLISPKNHSLGNKVNW